MSGKWYALIIAALFFSQNIFAQEKTETDPVPRAILFESGLYGGSELESAKIDALRNELRKSFNSKGFSLFIAVKFVNTAKSKLTSKA